MLQPLAVAIAAGALRLSAAARLLPLLHLLLLSAAILGWLHAHQEQQAVHKVHGVGVLVLQGHLGDALHGTQVARAEAQLS